MGNKILLIGSPRTGGHSVLENLTSDEHRNFGEILFCKEEDDCKSIIESRIQDYNLSKKCIAKVIPGQTPFDRKFIKRQCFKLCEMADTIYYTQRESITDQVISYAVACKQFDINDVSPWRSNRKLYSEQLSTNDLDKAFDNLSFYSKLVLEIYKEYPGQVFTLEDDLEYNPYPNRYTYNGDWQPPYKFRMLNG